MPQKPYLVPELDLFSNILYPAAVPDDPQVLNALLADLSPHLRLFSLEYLLPYLDPKSSLWGSPIAELRLSPSTTHKLALVRLLAATPAPAFAILDEAVAILRTREEELGFWRALAKRGTHVACISHGRVWGAQEHAEELQGSRFFTHRLRFLGRGTAGIDGEGEWVFERIAESPTLNAISSGVDEEPSGPLGATAHELETEFAPDELERLAELADAGDGRLAQLVKERKDLVKRLNEMEALRRKRDELASLMAGLH